MTTGEPGEERPRSAIRRFLAGYVLIVGLLCAGFAIASVRIVETAARERAEALIDNDVAETLEKLSGAPALRREKALAIVLARTALADERVYRLSEHGRAIAGLHGSVAFSARGDGWLEAGDPPLVARAVTLAPGVDLLVGRRLVQGMLTHRLLLLGAILLAGALLLAILIGLWAGRSLTARIAAINAACDRVRLGDFAARAPAFGASDEFAALASHVNAMLERIDTLVMGLRDVSNRIAHDLRTPVARLKHDLEEAAAAPDLKSARELAGAAAAETDEILQTFEALLDIAEVEAGGSEGLAPIRLDDAVRAACELYETVAEAAAVALHCRLEPVHILGERMLIVRLAANLIDNAIKFSGAGSGVSIEVMQAGDDAVLAVGDRGPGIPAGERDAVMGRFARGAGAGGVRGHGLGLALVSAVAKRHAARIAMADRAPGLLVSIRFPAFGPRVPGAQRDSG